jgi:glycosyltransferase involved in cell wall biosynthesis
MSESAEHPAVTVVIPCFNQARFLPAAVASVRAQHHQSVECVVVNDGSTDDTAFVASGLGVRVVEQPGNTGVSEARNAGLAAARTELVVFLDADDELLPEATALAAGALVSDPKSAAIVGRCQVMDVNGRRLPSLHNHVDPSNLYEQWLAQNFVWTPGAAMFRRRALEEIGGFPSGLGWAADYAVYLRLARTGRVRFIADELVRYRQHPSSMSSDPASMLRATLAVLRREQREAPASLRRSFSRGRRSWCAWYGEQIVERFRADWRAGRRGPAEMRAILTLVRYCPTLIVRHAARKTGRILGAASRRAPFTQLLAGRRRRVAP